MDTVRLKPSSFSVFLISLSGTNGPLFCIPAASPVPPTPASASPGGLVETTWLCPTLGVSDSVVLGWDPTSQKVPGGADAPAPGATFGEPNHCSNTFRGSRSLDCLLICVPCQIKNSWRIFLFIFVKLSETNIMLYTKLVFDMHYQITVERR